MNPEPQGGASVTGDDELRLDEYAPSAYVLAFLRIALPRRRNHEPLLPPLTDSVYQSVHNLLHVVEHLISLCGRQFLASRRSI